MARHSSVVVAAFLLFCCWNLFGQEMEQLLEYGYIGLPNGVKIVPRYSTVEEVIKHLGPPSRRQTLLKGWEDFYWHDFGIYYFQEGFLAVYFEPKNHQIIRIDANVPGLESFTFPFHLGSIRAFDTIVDRLSHSAGVTNIREHFSTVAYGVSAAREFIGVISVGDRVRRFSIYYAAPWETEGK